MKKEGEDQCRDLDETIRNRQLARKEAAAALEKEAGGSEENICKSYPIKKTASSLR